MTDSEIREEFRRRFQEASELRNQAYIEEREKWQAKLREEERKRQKSQLRESQAACLMMAVFLGLLGWGVWWLVSNLSDWPEGPPRHHAATAPTPSRPPLPPPVWKMDNEVDGSNESSLWTDMDDETTLHLLQRVSAEDTHSGRSDDLDDDTGLTAADAEITVIRQPEHAKLVLQADKGLAVYTPQPGFGGADTFEYTVKLRNKPETLKVKYTVLVGLSPGGRYYLEHKYENCDAARAAGAAPLRRGEEGYGRHLDRDKDGIACE
ncbi:excalibur calcium-binding domain-containing protein [Streptomyces sp. NPDC054865]